MPDIDGGHYFLTALFPVMIDPVTRADGSITAPSHALREALASLPTAAQSAVCVTSDRVSPFARCTRTHFARLFVLDQPAYNGRDPRNAILQGIREVDLLQHQPVDCLTNPWLVLIADFDVVAGEADGGLDSYLEGLWGKMEPELRAVFGYCYGFTNMASAADFSAYVKHCQVETTMPFNDYWTGAPPLKGFSLGGLAALLVAIAAVAAFGLSRLTPPGLGWLAVDIVAGAAVAALLVYLFVMKRGARAFPAAPRSDLPNVLKALYAQQRFARFAAEHQGGDPQMLHAAFGGFLAEVRPGEPEPTRAAGRIDV